MHSKQRIYEDLKTYLEGSVYLQCNNAERYNAKFLLDKKKNWIFSVI